MVFDKQLLVMKLLVTFAVRFLRIYMIGKRRSWTDYGDLTTVVLNLLGRTPYAVGKLSNMVYI